MKRDTRTDLLAAAEDVIRRKGYDAFSYADLAASVGIRKASIHHHFPHKADLCNVLVSHYREKTNDALAEMRQQSDTPRGLVAAIVRHYRNALGDGTSLCLCVALATGCNALHPDTLRQIHAYRTDVIDWLADALADPEAGENTGKPELAQFALALLEGAQLGARVTGDIGCFDAAVAPLLRLSQHQATDPKP